MTDDPIEYSWHSTPQLWCAHRRSYDGAPDAHCPIGFGRTKEEAAAELQEQEEMLADLKRWPITECRCMYGMGGRCVHCDSRMSDTSSH